MSVKCRIYWLILLGALSSGCLRVGLPEPVADPGGQLPANPRLRALVEHAAESSVSVLLLGGCDERGALDSSSLGHQYLFGVIPLTSLFLEHHPEQLLFETLTAELLQRGYTVYRASCGERGPLIRAVHPDWILEADLPALRINGFDLFFLRLMALDGDIRLRSWTCRDCCTDRGAPAREQRVHLDASEYVRYAHAPQLAALLQERMQRSVHTALPEVLRTEHRRLSAACGDSGSEQEAQVLVVDTPQFATPLPATLGSLVAQSYGFESVTAYSAGMLASLVRRSMAKSLQNRLTVVERIQTGSGRAASPGLWGLETQIEVLGIENGEAALTLLFRLRSGIEDEIVARCSTREREVTAADGSWVVTIEQAAGRLVGSFLAGPGADSLCEFSNSRSSG